MVTTATTCTLIFSRDQGFGCASFRLPRPVQALRISCTFPRVSESIMVLWRLCLVSQS
ncbi:hypothetical protein Plhal304r1_c008g0034201 [Plasmopara halstedii]